MMSAADHTCSDRYSTLFDRYSAVTSVTRRLEPFGERLRHYVFMYLPPSFLRSWGCAVTCIRKSSHGRIFEWPAPRSPMPDRPGLSLYRSSVCHVEVGGCGWVGVRGVGFRVVSRRAGSVDHGGLSWRAQVDQEHTAQQCRRRSRRIALWLLPAVESCPAPAVRNARCRSHRQRNAHARGQRIIQQKTLSTATRHAASATQLAITNGAFPSPPDGPAR